MTIDQAKSTIQTSPGVKVTHRYFSYDEFIFINDTGALEDENGYILPWAEFWDIGNTKAFQEEWRIYKQSN